MCSAQDEQRKALDRLQESSLPNFLGKNPEIGQARPILSLYRLYHTDVDHGLSIPEPILSEALRTWVPAQVSKALDWHQESRLCEIQEK